MQSSGLKNILVGKMADKEQLEQENLESLKTIEELEQKLALADVSTNETSSSTDSAGPLVNAFNTIVQQQKNQKKELFFLKSNLLLIKASFFQIQNMAVFHIELMLVYRLKNGKNFLVNIKMMIKKLHGKIILKLNF